MAENKLQFDAQIFIFQRVLPSFKALLKLTRKATVACIKRSVAAAAP